MKMLCAVLMLITLDVFASGDIPLDTVKHVDLNRYLGKWYEVARFENKFEKGCTASEANYSLRSDGDIKVVNKCRLGSPQGKLKEAIGRAWVVEQETNAKLKVQFFLTRFRLQLFAGDYWIIDLDPEYKYVLVGEKTRKYLWILSRTKELDPIIYEELVEKAKDQHFDTTKLVKIKH